MVLPRPDRPTLSRPLQSGALPWVALLASVRSALCGQDSVRFERLKERMLDGIESRFQAAEQALYGGRALVQSNGDVNQSQWALYVGSIVPFFDRGVVGLGYVQRVKRTDLDQAEQRIRSQGLRDFTAQRDGTLPDVYLVTH